MMELEELKDNIIELQQLIDDLESADRSLYLQDSNIFLTLVEIVDDIKALVANVGEDGILDELEDILLIRDIKVLCLKLRKALGDMLNEVLLLLREFKDIPWVEAKYIETYVNKNHVAGKTDSIKEFLEDTNTVSLDARGKTYSAIDNITQIELNELDYGLTLLEKICIDEEHIRKKVESALIEYSNDFYQKTLKGLKREAIKFKTEDRSLHLSPEIWGKVMENEENALKLAVDGELSSFHDKEGLYDGFSEEQCKMMEDNGALMQKILDVGTDDELFDFDYAAEEHIRLYSLLTPENIDLFYYLILRHNIIRCETFPELKEKYEEWLNKYKEETLSDADRALLESLLNYVEKADWQKPANSENVKKFITKLFEHREFRDFFKEGKAGETSRVEVSMANILGYLKRYNLLAGTPTSISNGVFGNDQVNNINKGKDREGNKKFKDLLPLMDKYRQELIV